MHSLVRLRAPLTLELPRLRFLIMVACCLLFSAAAGQADPVHVRQAEGATHGFLVVHDLSGKIVAGGEAIETVSGRKTLSRVTFRFRDGSVDDETTVFTQNGAFHLVSDHHVQRGPSFPHPMDVFIDAASGMVTVHSVDKDGQPKVTTEHVDLPADLSNGLDLLLVKNLRPGDTPAKLPLIAATPKPRLINLVITATGEDPFSINGLRRQAIHYVGKIELGGVMGVVAPLVGKQPEDFDIWVLGGKVPAILRVRGQMWTDGPVLDIELASPVWPPAQQSAGR